jgi:hypothetical protein
MREKPPQNSKRVPENKENKQTRREFLENLISFGFPISLSLREFNDLPTEREIRFYRSGETIPNDVTPIRIEKWKLFFDKKRIEDYFKKFPDRRIVFTLVNPNISGILRFTASQDGIFVLNKIEDENNIIMVALPPSYDLPNEDQIVYLHFREIETKGKEQKIVRDNVYPIKLNFYTYNPINRENFEIDVYLPIYSEVPLSNDLFKKIYEICKIFYNRFISYFPRVYIFEYRKRPWYKVSDDFGSYIYEENRIELASKNFTNPLFPNEGIITAFHELSHVIVKEIVFDEDQRLNQILFEVFKVLNDKSGIKVFSRYSIPPKEEIKAVEKLEDNVYFSIFDESFYIKKVYRIETLLGHPYDDYSELFASALTVLRFFPNEFIQRYNQLNPEQRKVVAKVVRTIFKILESILKYKDRSSEDIKELLPQKDLLKKAIQ